MCILCIRLYVFSGHPVTWTFNISVDCDQRWTKNPGTPFDDLFLFYSDDRVIIVLKKLCSSDVEEEVFINQTYWAILFIVLFYYLILLKSIYCILPGYIFITYLLAIYLVEKRKDRKWNFWIFKHFLILRLW